MRTINFPTKFLPGKTDNFVSNEVIANNLNVLDVWKYLVDTSKWEKYYDNAANIELANESTSLLQYAEEFHFDTFGFPIDAQVMELVEPTESSSVGRIAWHGWNNSNNEDEKIDVYHAFLLENLSENRVRILTQESQIGKAAKEMATQTPNPMLNGHQAWLDGLVKAAKNNY